jgi:hypothetical protein
LKIVINLTLLFDHRLIWEITTASNTVTLSCFEMLQEILDYSSIFAVAFGKEECWLLLTGVAVGR